MVSDTLNDLNEQENRPFNQNTLYMKCLDADEVFLKVKRSEVSVQVQIYSNF